MLRYDALRGKRSIEGVSSLLRRYVTCATALPIIFSLSNLPAHARHKTHAVTAVYFVPRDRQPESNWEPKMQTILTMLDQFYASEMKRNGFDHRRLNLELTTNGKPKIHLIRGKREYSYYHLQDEHPNTGDAERIVPELREHFDVKQSVVWVSAPGSGWHGMRYADYGGFAFAPMRFEYIGRSVDEQLEILCDPTIEHFPDGSSRARGRTAGIEIGGIAHELGHTFGAPHHRSPEIMGWHHLLGNYFVQCKIDEGSANGYPSLSLDNALLLNNSRFFNDAEEHADRTNPSVTLEMEESFSASTRTIPMHISVSDTQSRPALLIISLAGDPYNQAVHYEDLRGKGASHRFRYDFKPDLPLVKGATYTVQLTLFDGASNMGSTSRTFRFGKQ